MPIYAYKCESCGFAKDALQKMSDAPLTDCPSCGAPSFKKQLTAAGFQLKGTGWYVTDFRGGDSGKAAAKTAEGSSDGAAANTTAAPEASAPAVTPAAAPASAGAVSAPAPAPAAAPASKPSTDSSKSS